MHFAVAVPLCLFVSHGICLPAVCHVTCKLFLQGRQLVAAEASKQLEKIAHDLIEGPRNTLKSCQSTLGNCTENFQVLQTVLQHNLQPSLPLLKLKAEPSAPFGGHNTTFKTSGRLQAPVASTSQQAVATERITPEEMALDPWNILPGFLRAQELAAIEKAVNSGSPRHTSSTAQASDTSHLLSCLTCKLCSACMEHNQLSPCVQLLLLGALHRG